MMIKIYLGLSLFLATSVYAECNIEKLSLKPSESSKTVLELSTLEKQKVSAYVTANTDLVSTYENTSLKLLPKSNIMAFEYKFVMPINLTDSEVSAGWLLHGGSGSIGFLLAPHSSADGSKVIIVPSSELTPTSQNTSTH